MNNIYVVIATGPNCKKRYMFHSSAVLMNTLGLSN